MALLTQDYLQESKKSLPRKAYQESFKEKPHSPNRYPYILSGIIFCGECGARPCGKSAHGKSKKYPYYEHSRVTKSQGTISKQIYSCVPHRFLGEIVETKFWEAVEKLLKNPKIAVEIINQAKKEHSKLDYGLYCRNLFAEKIVGQHLPRQAFALSYWKTSITNLRLF